MLDLPEFDMDLEAAAMGAGLPEGVHTVTVVSAKHESGSKDGRTWNALDVGMEAPDGRVDDTRLFVPSASDYTGWSQKRRMYFAAQFSSLGIDPRHIDSETARSAIIGRVVRVEVSTSTYNGKSRREYKFMPHDSAGELPAAPPAAGAQPAAVTI